MSVSHSRTPLRCAALFAYSSTLVRFRPAFARVNPNAAQLWTAPRWALALLLACLSMLGPFTVDTYLPAFSGIAQTLHATPLQLQ